MKHFLLKFNHGVEIGARYAYLGHHQRTQDPRILEIANEEYEHQKVLALILFELGSHPSFLINLWFFSVGNVIRFLCLISPKEWLNYVAEALELFAVSSYESLGRRYPDFAHHFRALAQKEAEHEQYFLELKRQDAAKEWWED